MKMWPAGDPTVSGLGDRLARFYKLSLVDKDRREMSVRGVVPLLVFEDDPGSVTFFFSDGIHGSHRRSVDGRPCWYVEINSVVMVALTEHWVDTPPERGNDLSHQRIDEPGLFPQTEPNDGFPKMGVSMRDDDFLSRVDLSWIRDGIGGDDFSDRYGIGERDIREGLTLLYEVEDTLLRDAQRLPGLYGLRRENTVARHDLIYRGAEG